MEVNLFNGSDAFVASDAGNCMLTEDPLMTVRITDKKVGLTAFVAIHNLGEQGACGGIRCVPDISEDEVKALARAMAYKYAFFEQAQGGGKGGMVMDYDTPPERRRELAACLGAHLRPLLASGMYHAWTDMNFSVDDMIAVYRGAGLGAWPPEGESSRRTAISTLASVMAAAEALDIPPDKCRVAIEGLGNVGGILAQELVRWGGRVVAVSNRDGAVANDDGIPVDALLNLRQDKGPRFVLDKGPWRNVPRGELFSVAADILVPCARVHSITGAIAQRTPARAVVPAANVPCTPEAEIILEERGIPLLPDFIVNAGGILGFLSTAPDNYADFIAKMKGMQNASWLLPRRPKSRPSTVPAVSPSKDHALATKTSSNGNRCPRGRYRICGIRGFYQKPRRGSPNDSSG